MLSPEMKVAVGLMDEHYPGWRARVNTEELRLGGLDTCIVGQVVPRNRELERELGIGRFGQVMRRFERILGWQKFFTVRECFADDKYRPEWVEAIQAGV